MKVAFVWIDHARMLPDTFIEICSVLICYFSVYFPALLPKVFWCAESEVYLVPGEDYQLQIEVLPLQPVSRHCCVLLVSERLGEFVHDIHASVPMPLPLAGDDLEQAVQLVDRSFRISSQGMSSDVSDSCLTLCCGTQVDQLTESLFVSAVNPQRERAVAHRRTWDMTQVECNRRLLAGTLFKTHADMPADHLVETVAAASNKLTLALSCNSKHFVVDENVTLPLVEFDMSRSEGMSHRDMSLSSAQPASTVVPIAFLPDGPGRYPASLLLWSIDDVRLLRLEVLVNSSPPVANVILQSPAGKPCIQNIPVVSGSPSIMITIFRE